MKCLDATLSTPAENLACDEALLDWCEEGYPHEILRLWEPDRLFAVVGYGNETGKEIDLASCAEQSIPILRRCSGGGAVLQGPGCLNYSLILRIADIPDLSTVPGTNRWIMKRNCEALQALTKDTVRIEGHTDLVVNGRKFSGNAQRRRRHWVLFHGTFLWRFDLSLMRTFLRLPSKEPAYRMKRDHTDFLTNIPLKAIEIKTALRTMWKADDAGIEPPKSRIESLTRIKYRLEGEDSNGAEENLRSNSNHSE